MALKDSLKSLSMRRAEHISTEDGENINAKRVGNYVWNGSDWVRQIPAPGLVAGTDFDHIDGQQTSATVDTYVYKTGGSGGTTVQTVVVTYTNSAKTDVDTVAYS